MSDQQKANEKKMYLISKGDLSEHARLARGCGRNDMSETFNPYTIGDDQDLERFENEIRARGPAPVCDDTCVYKRFASNMQNAAVHDAEVAARITAQLTAQHEQELRDAVEGTKRGERERVLKLVCVECPVRNEEMPLEDVS